MTLHFMLMFPFLLLVTTILESSVVRTALEASVAVLASSAEIRGSAILDTQPQMDGRFGGAVAIQGVQGSSSSATIVSWLLMKYGER